MFAMLLFVSALIAAVSADRETSKVEDSRSGDAKLKALTIVQGKCKHLMVLGKDVSDVCQSKILNTEYDDGRSGFYFMTSDGAILTFSGLGSEQIKLNEDVVIQPIDMIIFTYKSKPDKVKAIGKCRFENPYKGSVPISCQAETSDGKFEADFMTDGSVPDSKRF